MQLQSTIEPRYFPDPGQTTVMRMGLMAMPETDWMQVDSDLPQFYQHKQEQAVQRKQLVFRALPRSAAAQEEFGRRLREHLLRHHGYRLANSGSVLEHEGHGLSWASDWHDLWHSCLWIQEDICLLEEIGGNYCLTAASVCSPSNWDMPAKLEQNLDVIHAPVPGYQAEMAARVNRLLRSLKTSKPIQRLNWSVQPSGDLFWRGDLKDYSREPSRYWRVERQTLVRLPDTGAVVFGIRVYLHSFEVMQGYQGFQQSLTGILRKLPDQQKRYKNLS